jgi:hypothetical protein
MVTAMDARLALSALPLLPEIDEDLPLKVAPDWDRRVEEAEEVCWLIDRHLDYEARGRVLQDRRDFRPAHLCPEQRVQMVSDLYAATR